VLGASDRPGWLRDQRWPSPEEQLRCSSLDLGPVLDSEVGVTAKGWPASRGLRLRDVATKGWNLHDEALPLPVLALRAEAVLNNLAVMGGFCAANGVEISPHGKTSMAPQLFALQLSAGAWGITLASTQQLQTALAFGVPRVMIANEVVGRPNLMTLAGSLATDPPPVVMSWVDSGEAVEELASAVREAGLATPVEVLLEVGYPGGRAGVRTDEQVDEVLGAVGRHGTRVRLVGVAGFEGLLTNGRRDDKVSPRTHAVSQTAYLEHIAGVATRLHGRGDLLDGYLLSAGGSTSFDRVVDAFSPLASEATVVLRSGCYLTHDHFMNARTSPLAEGGRHAPDFGCLQAALELWAYVLSTPEPGLAIVGCGRRDAPFDSGLPVPLRVVRRGRTALGPEPLKGGVSQLNDQHLYFSDETGLEVGDRVVFGISHPCTAFDKWALIPVIDAAGAVIDAVRTYF